MSAQDAEARRDEVFVAKRSTTATATQRLIDGLNDEDPLVREWAVEALIGRRDRIAAVPALIGRLEDDRADLRWYAARALGKLGVKTSEICQALTAALDDSDLYVRCFAAWALAQLRFYEEIPNLQRRLLRHGNAVGRRDEEAFSLGVALARLTTPSPRPNSPPPAQPRLPGMELVPAEAAPRPKTKQQILEEEILSTAGVTRLAREGETALVQGRIRAKIEYVRSTTIKELVLAERGRSCQLCGFTFRTQHGIDYAEAHHIIAVSQGGPDHGDNILTVCANHHRQLHYADTNWPDGTCRPPVVVINGEPMRLRWP